MARANGAIRRIAAAAACYRRSPAGFDPQVQVVRRGRLSFLLLLLFFSSCCGPYRVDIRISGWYQYIKLISVYQVDISILDWYQYIQLRYLHSGVYQTEYIHLYIRSISHDVFVLFPFPSPLPPPSAPSANPPPRPPAANPLEPSVFATSAPPEVAQPHNQSSFAPIEEIGAPVHDRDYEKDVEAATASAALDNDPDRPAPTEEERSTLRKVADSVPSVAYALCAVEFAERASYYGASTVFSNFMQFPLPAGGNGAGAPPRGTQETAGALGKGLQFSNAFTLLFMFLAYVIPILGAWIADTRLGRYKTIAIGVLVCGIAHIIMLVGAIPSVLQAGHAAGPFLLSLLILAFGAGWLLPDPPG
jgi:hypothetical protein